VTPSLQKFAGDGPGHVPTRWTIIWKNKGNFARELFLGGGENRSPTVGKVNTSSFVFLEKLSSSSRDDDDMKKTLKTVTGTLVPKVQPGSGPANRQMPARQNDRSHYHHPAIAVNEEDLRRWNNARGAPLIVEHGKGQTKPIQVGTVVDTTIRQDGSLYVVASVHDDEMGEFVAKRLEQGDFSGFSIGYDVVPDVYGNVAEKRLNEISLVVEPFFEQAKISVCATSSDANVYKTDPTQNASHHHHHLFVPMDNNANANATPAAAAALPQQQQSTSAVPPAAAAASQQQQQATADIKNFAAEVELKQLREQQAKKDAEYEQERARAKEMEEVLKKYRAKEEAEKRALIDAQVKELETTLKNVQKGLGLNELPKEFIEDQRKVAEGQILMEDNNPYKKHVEVQASIVRQIGSALASKDEEMAKMRAELAAQKAELEQARELQAKMQSDVKLASERIAASRDAIFRGECSHRAERGAKSFLF
jgi:hypothetical protein